MNGNGSLQLAELKVFLGDEAQSVVEEMDKIQTDGLVQFDEWASFFKAIPAEVVNTHLTQLEGIVASKDLENAVPPEQDKAATLLQSKARQKQATMRSR